MVRWCGDADDGVFLLLLLVLNISVAKLMLTMYISSSKAACFAKNPVKLVTHMAQKVIPMFR